MPRSKRGGRTATRWLVMTASAACLALTITTLAAAPSFAAGTYSTTGSVNVRSGPGTGYQLIGTEPGRAQFTLRCQWQGGTSIYGNATWDDVTFANGLTGAITDYFTTTPSWNSYAPGTGACGASAPSLPSGGSLGGVDMQGACNAQYSPLRLQAIVTNVNSAYSWQCVGPGVSLGINVTAECQLQYGYGAVAAVSNPASAWSWYCHWNITPQMQNAVIWEQAHATSQNWKNLCETAVEHAYGVYGISRGGFYTAMDNYNAQYAAHRIHADRNAPIGALVFFAGNSSDGHVGLAAGDGQNYYTTDGGTIHLAPLSEGGAYYGWSFAPASWPGV